MASEAGMQMAVFDFQMPVCVCIVTEESVCGQLYTMYCTNTSLYNTILCVSKVVAAAVTRLYAFKNPELFVQ